MRMAEVSLYDSALVRPPAALQAPAGDQVEEMMTRMNLNNRPVPVPVAVAADGNHPQQFTDATKMDF